MTSTEHSKEWDKKKLLLLLLVATNAIAPAAIAATLSVPVSINCVTL